MCEYKLPLEEDQILFFAEVIALMYCAIMTRSIKTALRLEEVPFFPLLLEKPLRENLRALLREPLRDPHFRRSFNEYFSTHEHADVRDAAWDWMQDALVWDE